MFQFQRRTRTNLFGESDRFRLPCFVQSMAIHLQVRRMTQREKGRPASFLSSRISSRTLETIITPSGLPPWQLGLICSSSIVWERKKRCVEHSSSSSRYPCFVFDPFSVRLFLSSIQTFQTLDHLSTESRGRLHLRARQVFALECLLVSNSPLLCSQCYSCSPCVAAFEHLE